MNCNEQFQIWKDQVQKLKQSVSSLSQTEPKNVLEHFFLRAAGNELATELVVVKKMSKNMICAAIKQAPSLSGDYRQKSVTVLKQFISVPIIQNIHLADIRNIAVFEIYKQCGITIDTYFDRYSTPPGNAQQNEQYSRIAHGTASASAENTQLLSHILLYMQILKRFFTVYDIVNCTDTVETHSYTLNWLGAMWAAHVAQKSLSDLIWELFLDIWYYEQ